MNTTEPGRFGHATFRSVRLAVTEADRYDGFELKTFNRS